MSRVVRALLRREPVRAGLIFAGLLCGAYWNVVFTGKSLVYGDQYNPLDANFVEANYGPGLVPPDVWLSRHWMLYPNFHDAEAVWWQWEPAGEFLRSAIRTRQPPWWDPYVGGGAPAMANLTQAFLFPPSFLVVALGNGSTLRTAYYLAMLFAAGMFTFLLLRRHRLGFAASLAGGAAFMLGGALTQHVGSFVGQTAACFPMALYVTRWFVDRPTWGRSAVLAVSYAAISLASFLPLLIAVFGFAAAYAIAMCVWGPAATSRRRSLARYLAAVASSLGLVAFYYLPAFAAFRIADQALEHYGSAGSMALPPPALYQLLSPVLAGGAPVYLEPLMPGMGTSYLPYAGIVALCLAALADRRGQGSRGPLFGVALALALLVTAKLVGIPPVQWLGLLPLLRHIHYGYHGNALGFLIALLVAMGVENLVAGRLSSRRIAVVTALVSAAVGSLFALAVRRGAVGLSFGAWLFEWSLLLAFAAATLAVTLMVGRRGSGGRRPQLAALAAVALLGGEGVRYAYFPRQVRAEVYRRPPPWAQLIAQRGPWSRVYCLGVLSANTLEPLGISTWDSLFAFNPGPAFQLYKRYTDARGSLFMAAGGKLPPEPLLDAAAIDVVAILATNGERVAEATGRGYVQRFEDYRVRLFTRASEPHCYFTSDFRVVPARRALEQLGDARPTRQVLLEQAPAALQPQANSGDDPPVRLTEWGHNGSRLAIVAPRPGLLYCADNQAPGWSAAVDGKPAPILTANHAFRAVPVPAGRHEVELSYWPPGLSAGLGISGAALLGLLGMSAAGLRARRGQSP